MAKGYHRNYYDICVLDAPVNPTTVHPLISSHQLCAIWLVKSWEQVPEALIKKAREVVNYANSKMCNEKMQKAELLS